MHAFDKIANKFDTSFEKKIESAAVTNSMAHQKLENTKNELAVVDQEKNELSQKIGEISNLPSVDVKDREFIESKCKKMIDRCEKIMDHLDNDIGEEGQSIPLAQRPRFYEAYATMVNAISIQVRELRELNKMVMGIEMVNNEQLAKQIEQEQNEQRKVKEKSVSLTMTELAEFIKKADTNNQLNAVDATFEILDKEGPKDSE